MSAISEAAIRERAYHIWIREGCPHGRDFEHWVQAQVELTAEAITGNGGKQPPAAPRSRAAAKPAASSRTPRNSAPRAARLNKR